MAFDVNASFLIALLPATLKSSWSIALAVPRPTFLSVWLRVQRLWSEDAALPRDGLILLVTAVVAANDVPSEKAAYTEVHIDLARKITKAARLIREDMETEGTGLSRKLLIHRRRQLVAIADNVDSQAAILLGVGGARCLENARGALTDLLRAWARDELEGYVARLPEPTLPASWRTRLGTATGPAVLFAVGLVAWITGGPVEAGGGATAMIVAGLTVANVSGPADMARMITGK